MAEYDAEQQFPNMQPIKSAPSLYRVNGCGLGMYGSRDHDPATGTYVKTHCICLLWIPILALRAYRVADADQGWYFLGREPLSSFARIWRTVLVGGGLITASVLGWHAYTSSPDYIARQQLAEAERLVAANDLEGAARLYGKVITGPSSRRGDAEEALRSLVSGLGSETSAENTADLLAAVVELQRECPSCRILAKPFEDGLAHAERFAGADPWGAVCVLDGVASLAKDEDDLAARREELLKRAVAQHPDDPEPTAELARIHETRGELDVCEALLVPFEDRLGTTEGARILGQIYAGRGEVENAFALLFPYAEGRLEALHQAEAAYDEAVERAWERAIARLEEGEGPSSFYSRYKAASEAEQATLVQEYGEAEVRDDPAVRARREVLVQHAGVVPVALDLGIVRLRRAETMTDPQTRRLELEAAEKTFLAIRGLAGETNEYRLYLAQVYYWLGKHDEGRALLDALLVANERSFDALMSAGLTLREVGASAEARALIEEAYESETDSAKRYQAARCRALLRTDDDDAILWLRRADPGELGVAAHLNVALARKALAQGRHDVAARHLRDGIEAYAKQAPTASTLNNSALAEFLLFGATGDRDAYDRGLEQLRQAVALEPGDSILLFNAATAILSATLMDVIGDGIDLRILQIEPDIDMLSHLYADAAGREPIRERLRAHPGLRQALDYFEKAMVLRPKDPSAYSSAAEVYRYLRDQEALQELYRRLEHVDLDLENARRQMREFLAGTDDAEHDAELRALIKRYEGLVKDTRARDADATFAAAVQYLLVNQMAASLRGEDVDADRMVSLAEAARAASPSSATRGMLTGALLLRAHRRLVEENASYAEVASRVGRSLAPMSIIAVALSHPSEHREAVASDPDVQRAVTLVVETGEAFPVDRSPWEWAMLQAVRPAEAESIAAVVQANKPLRLADRIECLVAPYSVAQALDVYWAKLSAGKPDEAAGALEPCAAEGVPSPFRLD